MGKYRILRELGHGGMGVVYLGRDDSLGRNVAIKVVNPRLEGVEIALARFAREARAIAQLSSPHIVQVYEFNPEGGQPYLVMEYVPGCGLDDLILQGGRLSYPEILDCACQILKGLSAAHRAGIIHRDIKPANVMCSRQGVYKLTDFGLARSIAAASGASLTTTGAIIGSLRYLAPEVAAGDEATPLSDIYSAGVTVYELISGATPFADPSPLKLVHQIATGHPVSVTERREDVPLPLEAWVTHVLAREPERRYASADEALSVLEAMEFGPMPEAPRYTTIPEPSQDVDMGAKTVDLGAATTDVPPPPAAPPITAAPPAPPVQPPPTPAQPAPPAAPPIATTAQTVPAVPALPGAPAQPGRTLGGCLTALLGVVVLLLAILPMVGAFALFMSPGEPWVQSGEPNGTVLTFGPGRAEWRKADGKAYRLTEQGFRVLKGTELRRRVDLSAFWLVAPPVLVFLLGLGLAVFMVSHGLRRPPPPASHTQVFVQVNR